MRIIGYTRVSTEEQKESRAGLDAQERAIRKAIEAKADDGWHLEALVTDEGLSAGTLKRPGLQLALQQLADGQADALMVAKLDRLSRSVIDFSLLLEWFTQQKDEPALIALDVEINTSTAGGLLVARIFAVVAEWERDVISERTKAGLASIRANGRTIGRPAVADKPELEARIRAMRIEQGMTLQAIADTLNAEGVPTIRGGERWRVSSVQSAAGWKRRRPRRRAAALPVPRAA